jgi:hypothetical protein
MDNLRDALEDIKTPDASKAIGYVRLPARCFVVNGRRIRYPATPWIAITSDRLLQPPGGPGRVRQNWSKWEFRKTKP